MASSKNKPQLFILSLPHTQLTADYVSCAYTMKALKLGIMMKDLDYSVVMLGSEEFDPRLFGTERVTCITKKEQKHFFGTPDQYKKVYYNITWGPEDPCWVHFNNNAISEIRKRIKPGDLILTFSGLCQQQIARAFPGHITVEAGIGYTGIFSKFRVYESYAWQNFVHGRADNDTIEWYETVIPNYWDPEEFPMAKKQGDYYLFLGRLIERKGYEIAQEVCAKLDKKLILAGQMNPGQEFSGYGEHIGTIGVKKRGKLMSKAIAVFTPTWYLGPFEGVHIEAQLCGVPVITTPFGVYNDTVKDEVNGYRCNDFQEFINAAKWAEKLSYKHRKSIRIAAQEKYSMKQVAHQYDKYFRRLANLQAGGWYQEY
jgi:glycosyltransferase involved in cell wall biosynthesis